MKTLLGTRRCRERDANRAKLKERMRLRVAYLVNLVRDVNPFLDPAAMSSEESTERVSWVGPTEAIPARFVYAPSSAFPVQSR